MKTKTIVSTGLICLDIIQQKQGYWLMAGGSAINPLLILHTWGWEVFPIGRIGNDQTTKILMQDIEYFRINQTGIFFDHNIQTPMYVMTMNDDEHIFHKQCPNCQTPFPTFTPLTNEMMDKVITQLPKHVGVCLIERLSNPAIRLVEECKSRGALVMFEPNRIEEESLLDPMLAMTDIVKYSNERTPLLAGIEQCIPNHPVSFEMQTLSSEGLRFRCLKNGQQEWINMPAVHCGNFVDAAGAGDWTTARFLHELMNEEDTISTLRNMDWMKTFIHQAQQEAAKNCAFPAPRGRMYSHNPLTILEPCKNLCNT
jgi:sugar/nucleoside kinase (ribokinase family)